MGKEALITASMTLLLVLLMGMALVMNCHELLSKNTKVMLRISCSFYSKRHFISLLACRFVFSNMGFLL